MLVVTDWGNRKMDWKNSGERHEAGFRSSATSYSQDLQPQGNFVEGSWIELRRHSHHKVLG